MIYEVKMTGQAELDLRGIYEYIALNYKHQKMQPDKFDAWKNKS